MFGNEKERGQSIFVIAIALVVLLGLVALVVDMGNAYAQSRIVQNAVDAAALAGTGMLAQRTETQGVLHIQVADAIGDYAEKNGLDRQEVQAWFVDGEGNRVDAVHQSFALVPEEARGVEVEGALTFDTYLAQLLGFETMTVDADTFGWVLRGPCTGVNLFPIALHEGFGGQAGGGGMVIFDDEAIDSDIPSIIDIAAGHGRDATWLMNDDQEWFSDEGNPFFNWNLVYPGDIVVLPMGEVGDEGAFSMSENPAGNNGSKPFSREAFYNGSVQTNSLDEVIGVAPLDNDDIQAMVGQTYGAVVFKSDVSMNYSPTNANLTGGRRGRFTFTVLDAQPCGTLHPANWSCSSSSLYDIQVQVESPLDYDELSGGSGDGGTTLPVVGEEYTLWDKGQDAPGNFGWIYWVDGDGVNRCPYDDCYQGPSVSQGLAVNVLDTTRSGNWAVGDWVNGDTGVNFGPLVANGPAHTQELDRRIEHHNVPVDLRLPPTVTIPIYNDVVNTGNNTLFQISAFGVFRLTCAYNGQSDYVEAYAGACAPCADYGNSSEKCVRGAFQATVIEPFEDGCGDTGIRAPSFRQPNSP